MIDEAEQFRVQLAGPSTPRPYPTNPAPLPALPAPLAPPPRPASPALPAPLAPPLREHLDDLLPMESAVLDEDVAGRAAGGRTAREKEVRHVRFERLGIQRWRQRLGV